MVGFALFLQKKKYQLSFFSKRYGVGPQSESWKGVRGKFLYI